MALRSFGFFAVRCYKYSTPTELWFLAVRFLQGCRPDGGLGRRPLLGVCGGLAGPDRCRRGSYQISHGEKFGFKVLRTVTIRNEHGLRREAKMGLGRSLALPGPTDG